MKDIESASMNSGEASLSTARSLKDFEKGLQTETERRLSSLSNSFFIFNNIHRQVAKLPQWLMPLSRFRIAWELIMFVATWYNAIVSPLRLFIMTHRHTPDTIVNADIAFDLLFLMDTFGNFFFPVIDDDTGEVIVDLTAIRRKYFGSWKFYVNFITCLPIIKLALLGTSRSSDVDIINSFIIALRMVRIVHFKSQFRELKLFLSSSGPLNDSFFRMIAILFITLLMMSVFGCVYFGLSLLKLSDVCPSQNQFASAFLDSNTWLAQDNIITDVMNPDVCESDQFSIHCNECPQLLFFVRSIYFLTQTLFTIGYGDSVSPTKSFAEMTTACVFLLFGVFIYSLIIANMTSVLANFDVVDMRYRKEKDYFTKWMDTEGLSDQIKQQVHLFFSYNYRKQYGMQTQSIFGNISPHLKQELANSYRDTICKVPFFNKDIRTISFLNAVTLSLEHHIHTPKSNILFPLEQQRELIIILEGRAEIFLKEFSESVGALNPGDYYGDYQLIFGATNEVGIFSPDFTETLSLSYESFKGVLELDDTILHDFEVGNGTFKNSLDVGVQQTIERSKAFMKSIEKSKSNIKKSQQLQKLRDMLKRDDSERAKGKYISPSSTFHVYRDLIFLVAILYYAISGPVRLCVSFRSSSMKTYFDDLFILDFFVDSLFVIDTYCQITLYAFIMYDDGREILVSDRDFLRRSYFESRRVYLNILCLFPYDILAIFVGYPVLMRLPKTLRLLQLPRVVSDIRKHMYDCLHISISESYFSSLIMFLGTVLLVIWSSLGWNALRSEEAFYQSIYWTFTTLTTVGYGDLSPSNMNETIYSIVVVVIGVTFCAGIIANVSSFFHDARISEDCVEHQYTCLKWFMERHNIAPEFIDTIERYFQYIEREEGGFSEERLVDQYVPKYIKEEIFLQRNMQMILSCDFFTNCDNNFIRAIILSLQKVVICSGYMILRPDVAADGMYFVEKGAVNLLVVTAGKQLKVKKTISVGEFFAEGSLFERLKSNPYAACATVDSVLWFLGKVSYENLLQEHPHQKQIVSNCLSSSKKMSIRQEIFLNAQEHAMTKATLYFHPDSNFICLWNAIVIIILFYQVIFIPFRVAFMESHELSKVWMICDYLGDGVLIFDSILNSRFIGFLEFGHIVRDKDKIWNNFLSSRKLYVHLISALPLEVLVIKFTSFCPFWKLQTWSMFRLNKLIRTIEMKGKFSLVELHLSRSGVKVPKNTLRVGKLIMLILLAAHIVGCMFFIIASTNQFESNGGDVSRNNWANDEGLLSVTAECPGIPVPLDFLFQRYIAALYWSTATLTTVGYGDISANLMSMSEVLFATIVLIIGTAIYTYVIALLEDIVAELDVTSTLYKQKQSILDVYFHVQGIPDSMKDKITKYYENLWRTQKGVTGSNLFKYLPCHLRKDLTCQIIMPLLNQTFFLCDCNHSDLRSISQKISLELYLPDDFVYVSGEICKSLMFISSGMVDLLTSQGVIFQSVTKCAIDEYAFIECTLYNHTAKSSNICEVFILSFDDFVQFIQENGLSKQFTDYYISHREHLIKKNGSMNKMIENFSSKKMSKMLDIDTDNEISRFVFLPNSLFKQVWDVCTFCATIYYVYSVPFRLSFSTGNISVFSLIPGFCIDLFFILDIYACCNHFAIRNDGFLIIKPDEFRRIYIQESFYGDTISTLPVSYIAFAVRADSRLFASLRLLQCLRARHFARYLNNLVEILNTRKIANISIAQVRICQMFFLVLVLSHWFACIFHLLGEFNGDDGWLVADNLEHVDLGFKYIRSLYWSFYTLTTVGYGSVPVPTSSERIFSMFVMIVGAVICDAGITAVLTSLISGLDTRAGANARRICCSKQYMSSYRLDPALQSQILKFYDYIDNELLNIDEQLLIDDLSPSLKCELLCHFCYRPLRESPAFMSFSHGGLISLIKNLSPYIAVPGEFLSIIGEKSSSIFILQRGHLSRFDVFGKQTNLATGTIVGHFITHSEAKMYGPSSKMCFLEIGSISGIKCRIESHFVTISFNDTHLRTRVRKMNMAKETLAFPFPEYLNDIVVSLREWKKNGSHLEIGKGTITLSNDSVQANKIELRDSRNKTTAYLRFKLSIRCLTAEEAKLSHHETSVVAIGFCHLYRLPFDKIDWVDISSSSRDHSSNLFSLFPIKAYKKGFKNEIVNSLNTTSFSSGKLNKSTEYIVENRREASYSFICDEKKRNSHDNRIWPIPCREEVTNTEGGHNEEHEGNSISEIGGRRKVTFLSKW